jgi:hypothetical protein
LIDTGLQRKGWRDLLKLGKRHRKTTGSR